MKYLTVVFSSLLFSCNSNFGPDDLFFSFDLINEEGISTDIFAEGENILFSFSILNQSEKTVTIKQMDFSNESDGNLLGDFFRVYRKEDKGFMDIGKPYNSAYCQYIGIVGTLAPNFETKYQIHWIPTDETSSKIFCQLNLDNSSLVPGNYVTQFDVTLYLSVDGDNYVMNDKSFRIDFVVH